MRWTWRSGGQLPDLLLRARRDRLVGQVAGAEPASRPVIVVLPNGSVQSITHKSDTSLTSSRLPVQLGGKVRKVGWIGDLPLTAECSALDRLAP